MTLPSPDGLAERLAQRTPRRFPDLPGRGADRRGAVLVPLIWTQSGIEAILTVRARGLRIHGGEVSFPGGKPDPEDVSLEATALREAREELGIEGARILGPLSTIPVYSSPFRLMPFLAHIPPEPLVPEPGEVAEILRVDLAAQLSAPRIHGLPWRSGGAVHLSPMFVLGRHILFGASAHVFHECLEIVASVAGAPMPEVSAGAYEWRLEGRRLRVVAVLEGRSPEVWGDLDRGPQRR